MLAEQTFWQIQLFILMVSGSPDKMYSLNTPFLKMTHQELDCGFQVKVYPGFI